MGVINTNFRLPRRRRFLRYTLAFTIQILSLFAIFYYGFQPSPVVQAESYLTIPQLRLTTPVITVQPNHNIIPVPDRIAGLYYANPNKLFLVGHFNTVFQDLTKLKVGDEITLAQDTYLIKSRLILSKSEINMQTLLAAENQPTLIIMTCAGQPLEYRDYSHRLILTSELVSKSFSNNP